MAARTRSGPSPHQRRLGLAAGLVGALGWLCCQVSGHAGGFGRWQAQVQQCSIQGGSAVSRPGWQARRCQVVRLEQNLEGLLSVRFLSDGSGVEHGAEHLLFAGVLEQDQRPMHCSADGRCRPSWPTRLVVATLSASRFDGRGLPTGVPRTQLVQGECEVTRAVVRCEARNAAGDAWSAQARL